jgi:hypothetical protein
MSACSLCGELNTVSIVVYDKAILGLQVSGWKRYECSSCEGEWVDLVLFDQNSVILHNEIAKEWWAKVPPAGSEVVSVTLSGMTVRRISHLLRDYRQFMQLSLEALETLPVSAHAKDTWIKRMREELEKKI